MCPGFGTSTPRRARAPSADPLPQGRVRARVPSDGTLYFLSGREDNDPAAAKDQAKGTPACGRCPSSGEAALVARHPGGIAGFTLARTPPPSPTPRACCPARPTPRHTASCARTAPTPRSPRSSTSPGRPGSGTATSARTSRTPSSAAPRRARLTVDAGGQGFISEAETALSPDGTRVAHTRFVPGRRCRTDHRTVVVVADAATGEQLLVVDRDGYVYGTPLFTADGTGADLRAPADRDVREAVLLHPRPHRPGERRGERAPGRTSRTGPSGSSSRRCPDDATALVHRRRARPLARLPARPRTARSPGSPPPARTPRSAWRPTDARCTRCAAPSTPRPLRSASTPPRPIRNPSCSRRPAASGRLPGTLTEVHTVADDGFPLRVLARAARGRLRRAARAADRLPARRARDLLERLDVALEPLALRGPRLRGPAARPRAVGRLRPPDARARLGPVGRSALPRSDGDDRRRRGPPRHRRDPHRPRGRLVRRLPGQPGRHPHRPLQGDRLARLDLGPALVPGRHGRLGVLPARSSATR